MHQGGHPTRGLAQTQDKTWASVAAQAARTAYAAAAPQRAMVRVRLEETQGKAPKELLEVIQRKIPAAYAIRTLHSGDIDVHVTSQTAKDQVLNGPDAPGFKILRKDYLLEIPGVPFDTPVTSGRNANNSELINSICDATKRLVPDKPSVASDGSTIERRMRNASEALSRRRGYQRRQEERLS